MSDLVTQANLNIKYYVLVRIFAKRVFLPLTAIYFMQTANFSIVEIGVISAFFSFIQFIAEIPTGYFADRIGRIRSIQVGALFAALATTIYVFFHTKAAIYLGVGLEALGYSFFGGAGEALIHDSLVAKKQESLYAKTMSNNMAISLVANSILVATASYTYSLDPRYPFILGTLAYLCLFASSLPMKDLYPPKPKLSKLALPSFTFIRTHKSMLLFGITFGLISALYTSPNDTFNVALTSYGLNPSHLGIIYGIGSLAGFLVGLIYTHLRKLSITHYTLLDTFLLLLVFCMAYLRSVPFLAFSMVIAIAFWRYRRIMYQDYLFRLYPNAYKATLVSTLNNLDQLNSIWLPLAITSLVAYTSLPVGLGLAGLATLLIAPFFIYSSTRFLTRPG